MLGIKGKKGELTTTQLVTIIVLITSFVIILVLIFRLNLGQTTDAEICRNSVVLQGKTPLSGAIDCKTQYFCISGGEDCTNISTTEKISAETKEGMMLALADKMSECWWMFGEGKIDYVGTAATEKTYCSVCSIVAFDEQISEKVPSVTYGEFYNYLKTENKTGSQTYLQYLYGTNNPEELSKEPKLSTYLENTLQTGKEYFILTGVAKDGWFTTGVVNLFDLPHTPYPVVILEKTPENYDSLGCGEFVTKA